MIEEQDAPVQEHDGVQRLVLCRRSDVLLDRPVVEEGLDLGSAELQRVTLAMEHGEPLHPGSIRLLRARAVVPHPKRLAEPVEELRRRRAGSFRRRGRGALVARLPMRKPVRD
jgi:hypothetical protein